MQDRSRMLTGGNSGVAAMGFAHLLLLLAPALVVGEFPVPMPDSDSCPECSFGEWTCPGGCNEDYVHLPFYYNFTQASGECWDAIPVDSHTVAREVDVNCKFGESIGCDSMEARGFAGISLLSGCQTTTPNSEDLFVETCTWKCKDERPVARCEWAFNPAGPYQAGFGTFETCWVKPTCYGATRVQVEAACEPDPVWMDANNTAAQLATVRMTLEQLAASHQDIEQQLAELRSKLENASDHNETLSKVLANAEASRDLNTEAILGVMSQLNTALIQLAEETVPDGTATSELTKTSWSEQRTGQELLALIHELSEMGFLLPPGQLRNRVFQQMRLAKNMYDALGQLDNMVKVVSQEVQDRLEAYAKLQERHAALQEEVKKAKAEMRQAQKDLQSELNDARAANKERAERDRARKEEETPEDGKQAAFLTLLVVVLGISVGLLMVLNGFLGRMLLRRKAPGSESVSLRSSAGIPSSSGDAEESSVVVGRPINSSSSGAAAMAAEQNEKPSEGVTV